MERRERGARAVWKFHAVVPKGQLFTPRGRTAFSIEPKMGSDAPIVMRVGLKGSL